MDIFGHCGTPERACLAAASKRENISFLDSPGKARVWPCSTFRNGSWHRQLCNPLRGREKVLKKPSASERS